MATQTLLNATVSAATSESIAVAADGSVLIGLFGDFAGDPEAGVYAEGPGGTETRLGVLTMTEQSKLVSAPSNGGLTVYVKKPKTEAAVGVLASDSDA